MNDNHKAIILSALELKEASIKRAQNTNKNPRFTPVYEAELADLHAARAAFNALK